MSKKGTEMSINIVVGMILGIAMLSAGILLFFNIFSEIIRIDKQINENMKLEIDKALDSGEQIYVPDSLVYVKRNSAHFWIGIRNIGNEATHFRVIVTEPNPPFAGNPSSFNSDKIIYITDPYLIKSKENEYANVAVGMKGVTEKVTLQIKVEVEHEGAYESYGKPKLITIQP